MEIPPRIKIGNYWYVIKEMNFGEDEHYGGSDEESQTIWLSPKIKGDLRTQTLFHEIIHQIFCQAGYLKENKDEKLIDLLASGIYQVLLDNHFIHAQER